MSTDASNPFSGLTNLALDIYSIPTIMSSECERVLSETKRVTMDKRKTLKHTTIRAIQCQKDWLTNKAIHFALDVVAKDIADE